VLIGDDMSKYRLALRRIASAPQLRALSRVSPETLA
jgi:hypothetical protein